MGIPPSQASTQSHGSGTQLIPVDSNWLRQASTSLLSTACRFTPALCAVLTYARQNCPDGFIPKGEQGDLAGYRTRGIRKLRRGGSPTEWTSGPLSPEYGGNGDPLDDAITLGGEKWNVLEIKNRNSTLGKVIDYQYQSVENPNIIFRVGKDSNGQYVGKIDISGQNGPITKETLHY